jgi:sugar (pentulose or hexulose) kinase
MTGRYVIGIDGGTEGLRAAVVDLEGEVLGMAASAYETRFTHPAWAEQDPADWWRALGIAVRGAVAQAGVKAGEIGAIGLDTTCCSVVALDAEGEALRPALTGWTCARPSMRGELALITGSSHVADAPILGSAILAAVGVGLHRDLESAVAQMVHVERRVEPDAHRHEAYRPFYEAYKDSYRALAPILHRQAASA